jgi:hypothetical protein
MLGSVRWATVALVTSRSPRDRTAVALPARRTGVPDFTRPTVTRPTRESPHGSCTPPIDHALAHPFGAQCVQWCRCRTKDARQSKPDQADADFVGPPDRMCAGMRWNSVVNVARTHVRNVSTTGELSPWRETMAMATVSLESLSGR